MQGQSEVWLLQRVKVAILKGSWKITRRDVWHHDAKGYPVLPLSASPWLFGQKAPGRRCDRCNSKGHWYKAWVCESSSMGMTSVLIVKLIPPGSPLTKGLSVHPAEPIFPSLVSSHGHKWPLIPHKHTNWCTTSWCPQIAKTKWSYSKAYYFLTEQRS